VTRLSRAALVGGIMFMVVVALVVMIWWSASRFDGAVTAGELAQFMIYALMATNALSSISEIMGTLQTVAGATERLIELWTPSTSWCPPFRRSSVPPEVRLPSRMCIRLRDARERKIIEG
jgi:ATP-binding cassette subfamily B protein